VLDLKIERYSFSSPDNPKSILHSKVRRPIHQLMQAEADDYDTDAITSRSPCILHDLVSRPSWLPFNPCPDGITIPLPRGPTKQHSLQPLDEVLLCAILDFHGCWIRCVFLVRIGGAELMGFQELLSALRSGRRTRTNRGLMTRQEDESWLYS
jgi:hypothetical protein